MGGVRAAPGEATPLEVPAGAEEALYEAERAGGDRVAVPGLELGRSAGPRLASWIEYIRAPIGERFHLCPYEPFSNLY